MPCEVCWPETPDFGCPTEMAPQDFGQVMGEKKRSQGSDVSFAYCVMWRFLNL
jgi:hypothetical protein